MNQPLAQALVVLGVVFVLLIGFQSSIQRIWKGILSGRRTDGEDATHPKEPDGKADEFGPLNNPFPDDADPPEDEVMNLSEYRLGDEYAWDDEDDPAEPGLAVDAMISDQDEGWVPPTLDRTHDNPESVPGHDQRVDRESATASLLFAEDDNFGNPPLPSRDDVPKASGISRLADTFRFLFRPFGRGKGGGRNSSVQADREQARESLSDSLGSDDAGTDGLTGSFDSKRVGPQLDLFDDHPEESETGSPEEPPVKEAPQDSPRPEESSDPEDDGKFEYPEIEGFTMISQIDYWAKISGGQDADCQQVMPFYNHAAPLISELTQIYGLCLPEMEWRNLRHEPDTTPVRDVVITVQLADRHATISRSSMEKYISMNTRIAKGTGKELTFMASPQNAMKQAHSIVSFAQTYQPVCSITVVSDKGKDFHGEEIHNFASRRGLHPVDPGFYVRHKTVGKNKVTLYSLVNMTRDGTFDFSSLREELTRGVVFYSLPILHNSPGAVFSEMADSARAFASSFRAQAMLPDAAPLTQEETERCRRQIESRVRRIEALGIMSGSDEAVRIFGKDAN